MVQARIQISSRTKLVVIERDESSPGRGFTAKSYLEALETRFIQYYEPSFIFQQDNARIHKIPSCQEQFKTYRVQVIDWPPHSPNLNPIELVQRLLKLKLFQLYPELAEIGRSQDNWEWFRRCLIYVWDSIEQAKIDSLIRSVLRRIATIRRARGYYTKYQFVLDSLVSNV